MVMTYEVHVALTDCQPWLWDRETFEDEAPAVARFLSECAYKACGTMALAASAYTPRSYIARVTLYRDGMAIATDAIR
jgi:hypothetical protein